MLKLSKILAVSAASLVVLANVSTASAQAISEPSAISSVQTVASGAVFVAPGPDGFVGTNCPANTLFIPADDANVKNYTAVALTALATGSNVLVRGSCAGTILVPNLLSITTAEASPQ